MCGENSGLIAGEEPDIISDRSPFGAFHAPPSPRVSASGMGARFCVVDAMSLRWGQLPVCPRCRPTNPPPPPPCPPLQA